MKQETKSTTKEARKKEEFARNKLTEIMRVLQTERNSQGYALLLDFICYTFVNQKEQNLIKLEKEQRLKEEVKILKSNLNIISSKYYVGISNEDFMETIAEAIETAIEPTRRDRESHNQNLQVFNLECLEKIVLSDIDRINETDEKIVFHFVNSLRKVLNKLWEKEQNSAQYKEELKQA